MCLFYSVMCHCVNRSVCKVTALKFKLWHVRYRMLSVCINCRCTDDSASSTCAEKTSSEGPSVKKHAADMMAVALERKKKLDKDKKKTLKRL